LKKPEIIERAALHPFNEDRLIIETGSGLYVFDARKLQIEKVFSNEKNNKILTWAVDNPNIYIVKSKDYAVSLYNLITKTEADVVKLPESSSMVREIKVFNSQIGVLEKSGALSLFNAKEKKFRLVADNAEKFHFSPDNKKIFFMGNDGKINIYFIGDWYKNIKKKPGDIISFDLKNKGLAKNAFWHKDSFHLFVEYGSGNPNLSLEFMEIDDRQPLNQYPIIAESESNYYEAAQNLLCFIQNKTLYSIKY
jgi:WD40 repeat protein